MAAHQRRGARLRIEARAVVVDLGDEVEPAGRVGDGIARGADDDPRARPFAGVVEEIADEVGQILRFAAKAQAVLRLEEKASARSR